MTTRFTSIADEHNGFKVNDRVVGTRYQHKQVAGTIVGFARSSRKSTTLCAIVRFDEYKLDQLWLTNLLRKL